MRRRIVPVIMAAALAASVLVASGGPADSAGTAQWPHFLRIHVEQRRWDTRILVDAAYAGVRWFSQPGVETG